MRKFLIGSFAAVLAVVLMPTATAAPKKAAGVSLMYWQLDGGTRTTGGFTSGPSADGDRKAITLNGGAEGWQPTDILAVSFEGWWGQSLAAVGNLKVTTQEPLAGGAPRISVTLSSAPTGAGWDRGTLYLDPNHCNTSNSNGWRTSNWRGGVDCTIWDDQGRSYTGTPAVFDELGTLVSPAVSAWDVMLASGDHSTDFVYYAYLIQDQPIVSRVDRITIDSKVFSK